MKAARDAWQVWADVSKKIGKLNTFVSISSLKKNSVNFINY